MFNKPPCDEEIFFDNGTVRWVRNIVYIEEGKWCHLMTKNGTEVITNPNRILFVRVYDKSGKTTRKDKVASPRKTAGDTE